MCRKRLSSPRCRSELIDSAWLVNVPGQKCINKRSEPDDILRINIDKTLEQFNSEPALMLWLDDGPKHIDHHKLRKKLRRRIDNFLCSLTSVHFVLDFSKISLRFCLLLCYVS